MFNGLVNAYAQFTGMDRVAENARSVEEANRLLKPNLICSRYTAVPIVLSLVPAICYPRINQTEERSYLGWAGVAGLAVVIHHSMGRLERFVAERILRDLHPEIGLVGGPEGMQAVLVSGDLE